MPELKDIRLRLQDGKPNGDDFRFFITELAVARGMLQLPKQNKILSWDGIGVELVERSPHSPATKDLHTLLKRMHFVLALPPQVFQKPGSFHTKWEALQKKTPKSKLRWAVYLVQHSLQFAELSIEEPLVRRCELVAKLQEKSLPVWDSQFVWTSVAESSGHAVGYDIVTSNAIQGSPKSTIQASMKEISGCGDFFAQHAVLLLTGGGFVSTAKKMGITRVQDDCLLGSGSHRLLRILQEESMGFRMHRHAELSTQDYNVLALKEREQWRAVALRRGVPNKQLPLCLQKARLCLCDGPVEEWVLLPEAFGDLLCEGAQIMRQLLGAASLRSEDARGWADMASPTGNKRRRTKTPE